VKAPGSPWPMLGVPRNDAQRAHVNVKGRRIKLSPVVSDDAKFLTRRLGASGAQRLCLKDALVQQVDSRGGGHVVYADNVPGRAVEDEKGSFCWPEPAGATSFYAMSSLTLRHEFPHAK
jgi:hypothetical protein